MAIRNQIQLELPVGSQILSTGSRGTPRHWRFAGCQLLLPFTGTASGPVLIWPAPAISDFAQEMPNLPSKKSILASVLTSARSKDFRKLWEMTLGWETSLTQPGTSMPKKPFQKDTFRKFLRRKNNSWKVPWSSPRPLHPNHHLLSTSQRSHWFIREIIRWLRGFNILLG